MGGVKGDFGGLLGRVLRVGKGGRESGEVGQQKLQSRMK